MKIKDSTYIKRTLILFITTVILFIVTLTLSSIFGLPKESIKGIMKAQPDNIESMKGLKLVGQYIIHNGFNIPFRMIILALIPIPFIYFFDLFLSSILMGIVFGFTINWEFKYGVIMTVAAIPHTVLEISAMSFMASGLYMLNKSIIRKIANKFKKYREEDISFKLAMTNLIKIYLLWALPLFILAAFLEAYLPKFIIHSFL